MPKLIDFSLRQSVLMNIIFVGICLFGLLIAVPNISVDRFPNIDMGQIRVMASYPGASPEDVERLVIKPIEDSLQGMENLEFVQSISRSGGGTVLVKFIDDTDYEALYDELRFRILGIQNQLPTINGDPLTPDFTVINADEWIPVLQINLIPDDPVQSNNKRHLVLLADELRVRFEQIAGVKEAMVLGDDPVQFEVVIDQNALALYRLSLDDVINALRLTGQAPPAGSITDENGEHTIRVESIHRTRSDVLDVVIRKDGNGALITVGDVIKADETGIRRLNSGIRSSINGLEAVSVKVLKTSSANATTLKDVLLAEADKFMEIHKNNNLNYTVSHDSTTAIKDSMGVLQVSFLTACTIVMMALFAFLAEIPKPLKIIGFSMGIASTIIVAFFPNPILQSVAILAFSIFVFITCRMALLTVSGIIISFLGSLILLYLTGYSLNELTLLGFVLTVGIIVDDAIVVLENIRRHQEEGKHIYQAVIDGTREVFWPIISATATTCAAFLPMLMMTGMVGDFFALIPIAVTLALAISLFECLLILPVHVVDLDRVLPTEKITHRINEDGEIRDTRVEKFYKKILGWNLRHPIIVLFGTAMLFFFAIGILVISDPGTAKQLGIKPPLVLKFFPEDMTAIWVSGKTKEGSDLENTHQFAKDLGQHLIKRGPGEIGNIFTMTGLYLDSSYQPQIGNRHFFAEIELPAKDNRSFDDPRALIDDIRKDVEKTFAERGIEVTVQPRKDGPPTGAPINVRISGGDHETVSRLADDMLAWMRSESNEDGILEGHRDLVHDNLGKQRVLHFKPNNEQLAYFDIPMLSAQNYIAAAYEGSWVGNYRRSDDDIPIKVRLEAEARQNSDDILSLPIVKRPDGYEVRFADIGQLQSDYESERLIRRDNFRSITITGDLRTGVSFNISAVENWYAERAAQYPGCFIAFGGETESTAKSYRSLASAFLIAVLLIYGILAAQFRSYTQPLLIMSNIVFSFTGVVITMAVFSVAVGFLPEGAVAPERSWFTVQSFIAIVGLTGLVINDAIVLIDFINRLRRQGLSLHEALLQGGAQRMRPIMMTTITTIAGLLPIAIGIPDFSITWGPFATCFVAGLALSTLMTLFVVPVLYEVLDYFTSGFVKIWMVNIAGKKPENFEESTS